jgi:hypothetical protein
MNELNKDQIKETWGDEFLSLVDDNKIKFTDSEIIVELSKPVSTIEDGETKFLKVKEPTVSELRIMDTTKGDMAKSIALLGACADLAEATITNLKTRDFMRIQKVILCFLGGSQQTGNK